MSAGLALGASSMSRAFASFAAGRLMVRTSYRLAAVIGGLSLVAGALLLIALEPSRGLAWAITGSFGRGGGFGAALNFRLRSRAPEAADSVNRLLDPGLRHSLGTAELAYLSNAIASSLHLVYIIAGIAAVVTLVLACALPAALSPTRPLDKQIGPRFVERI